MFGLSIVSLVVGAVVGAVVAPVTKFIKKQFTSVEAKANTVISTVEKKL